jgi:hypothetical protein
LDRSRAELFYLWSRRWLEAQRDAGSGAQASEIAAIEGHLNRMRDLDKLRIIPAFGSCP